MIFSYPSLKTVSLKTKYKLDKNLLTGNWAYYILVDHVCN